MSGGDSVRSTADVGELRADVFRLVVEACPSCIVLTDGDGMITLINEEVERLFGYRREELYAQPIEVLLPERSRRKHAHQRTGFMTQPGARRLGTGRDFSGRRKDGSEFPIEVGLNPIRYRDSVLVLCCIVDISERKRLEQLQDEFVSTVSHELRTPITSIAAALGLLTGGMVGDLPDPTRQMLAIAHSNCQRLVRLINDILDIKKLEFGQMTLSLQRSDAGLLLEKAIEANRAIADSYGVRIRYDALPHNNIILVDPDRFIQVVTNLLSNAIKFSPREKEVVVTTEKRGDRVHISVRDFGLGIPPEFKPHVFEKFTQSNETIEKKKGGSGLGLAIAKQIVELMRGRIWFDDAAGGGTAFNFDLPSADCIAGADAKSTSKANPGPVVAADN